MAVLPAPGWLSLLNIQLFFKKDLEGESLWGRAAPLPTALPEDQEGEGGGAEKSRSRFPDFSKDPHTVYN